MTNTTNLDRNINRLVMSADIRRIWRAALLASIGCGVANTTYAENAKLEEVLVTAQHRTERLDDVPVSITALSEEALSKSGVSDTTDIARVSSGVVMSKYGAFLQPAVRGVTSTGANIGDNSNVALYVDGVYQPVQLGSLIDMPDVQQVEVLKGPQGALYGQNATGGAILVSTIEPSAAAAGKLSASYGNYNAYDLRGYVSGGITDNVAASLSVGYQDRDGFRTQAGTGERDSGLYSRVIRGKIKVEPTDSISLTLGSYFTSYRDSSAYAGNVAKNNSLGYFFDPTAPKTDDPKKFTANSKVFSQNNASGVNLKAEFEFSAGTVESITGYQENVSTWLADVDRIAVDALSSTAGLSGRYLTEALNFTSESFGPLSFIAGAFYLNGSETFGDNGIHGLALLPTYALHKYEILSKEIYALYGGVTYEITDALTASVDGRFSHEEQRASGNGLVPTSFYVKTGLQDFPDNPAVWSKFTPRATLRYAIDADQNVYASYGKGFKSGGINADNLAQEPVKPENIDAYEVGYKGSVLDSLNLNAAAFYYDYTDMQFVAYNPPSAYIQQNAASAKIKGVDLSATWAATSELTLSSNITFLHSEYASFPNAQAFISNGFGNTNTTIDVSGNQMLRAPKLSGNISADYAVETSHGRFDAFTSVYYNSGYCFEVSCNVEQRDYATIDGQLSFEPIAVQGLKIALWGKNLADKAYVAGAFINNFSSGQYYGPPRTFGLRAEYAY